MSLAAKTWIRRIARGTNTAGTSGTLPHEDNNWTTGFVLHETDFIRYIADHVFALPTVAFFMCAIGVFILGHVLLSFVLGHRRFRGPVVWQKLIAFIRYLSYRGFYVKSLGWSSAPIGVLLLGLVGTVFFFCKSIPWNGYEGGTRRGDADVTCLLGMDLIPQPYYWPDSSYGGSPPLATRSGWMALACMPFVLYVENFPQSWRRKN